MLSRTFVLDGKWIVISAIGLSYAKDHQTLKQIAMYVEDCNGHVQIRVRAPKDFYAFSGGV